MPFQLWRRKNPRLKGYDNSQEGAYFITLCVQGRQCLFGSIVDGAMKLKPAGYMLEKWWNGLERKFPLTKIDIHVAMPNHFHGIIFLLKENQEESSPIKADVPHKNAAPRGAHTGAPLQKIMQWFKTMTTNEYIHGVKEHGWRPFRGQLWQRSFYDHVIRNDESLNRIQEYIATNPQRWELDRENPRAKGEDEFDQWLASFNTRPSLTCRGAPACAPSVGSRHLGDAGEDLAAEALKKQGYKILERNYTCPLGEVDLIARQGKSIVFVEVKTRSNLNFGGPREAVAGPKQARLRRLAEYYLKQQRLAGASVRFDVVGITAGEDCPQVEIIQDAF